MAGYDYRNPVLLADGRINCEIKFKQPDPRAVYGWMPHTAGPDDIDPTSISRELHAKAKEDKKLKNQPEAEVLAVTTQTIRNQRDALLKQSDWSMLADVPVATKEPWFAYRQALRDLPAQPNFPLEVKWPKMPK